MTLIVEDGTIVANSNSYISTANFTTYATARGYTLVLGAETLLVQAMDYLESLKFIGYKRTKEQTLQWPRSFAKIDSWWVDPLTIPQLLIDAQCEIAMAIDAGESPVLTISPKTQRIKAGSVEIDYALGSTSNPINRKISTKLHKLIVGGGGGFTVSRA